MDNLPTGRAGKLLALGMALFTLTVVYLTAVSPLLALYQSQMEDLERHTARADHLKRVAEQLPQLRASAERLKLRLKNSGDLVFAESSDVLAAATLQSSVKSFITEGGGSLTSVDTLPSQAADNMRKIGLRVSFSAPLPLLADVLRKVESAHPVLFIDNLDVHAAAGTNVADPGQQLSVALDIYGFRS